MINQPIVGHILAESSISPKRAGSLGGVPLLHSTGPSAPSWPLLATLPGYTGNVVMSYL